MIVLDASATVELLLATRPGQRVATRLRGAHGRLHAPHLISIEVVSALRRLAVRDEVGAARCLMALRGLARLPVRRWGHEALLGRVWELRDSVSAYDATYLALAEALDATLVTTDGRLAGATGHRARVEVVSV